jgi:hypothetical protein
VRSSETGGAQFAKISGRGSYSSTSDNVAPRALGDIRVGLAPQVGENRLGQSPLHSAVGAPLRAPQESARERFCMLDVPESCCRVGVLPAEIGPVIDRNASIRLRKELLDERPGLAALQQISGRYFKVVPKGHFECLLNPIMWSQASFGFEQLSTRRT